MNLYALASLSLGIASAILAIIVFVGAKRKLHIIWGCMNVAITVFGFGTYMVGIARTYDNAFFSWQITFCGIPYIAVLFYHTVYEFCGLKSKRFLLLAHLHGALFALTSLLTPWVVHDLKFLFGQFYYYQAHWVFNSFFFFWILIVVKSFYHLFNYILTSKGLQRTQGEYFFYGMLIGFLSGATTAIPSYGFNIYPGWHFFVCVYAAIQTYALFRYQLLDIRIAVTRFGIFIIVYSLMLGIPFWLGFKILTFGLWIIPTGLCAILASIAPYIYIYIQKKAEDKILQEQRIYQSTLRKASYGMGQIKDIKKLLQLIVHVVTRSVRIEHCEIYLYHEESGNFVLKASKGNFETTEFNSSFTIKTSLIQQLNTKREPLVYEEVKQRSLDSPNSIWGELKTGMELLNASIIIPSFIDHKLISFFVLGNKKSKKLYSADDLVVFSILANQSAIAIENAMSLENIIVYQKKVSEAEKAEQFSAMAQGMAHQINNRLHAMNMVAGDKLDDIKVYKKPEWPAEYHELIDSLGSGFLKIRGNLAHATEIVQGFMKLGKFNKPLQFTPYNFRKLLSDSIRMARTKKDNLKAISLTINIPKKLPDLMGDSTLMKEVFFNLIDNAYDAIDEKKMILKDPLFTGKMDLAAISKDDEIIVTFTDNGIGVKDENKIKFFVPMWTTKVSSRKGNGFGLFVIRTIIEKHGGKIGFTSKYMDGITFVISLPIIFHKNDNENTVR